VNAVCVHPKYTYVFGSLAGQPDPHAQQRVGASCERARGLLVSRDEQHERTDRRVPETPCQVHVPASQQMVVGDHLRLVVRGPRRAVYLDQDGDALVRCGDVSIEAHAEVGRDRRLRGAAVSEHRHRRVSWRHQIRYLDGLCVLAHRRDVKRCAGHLRRHP
jgi:hypothetical protein